MKTTFIHSIHDVDKNQWNDVCGKDYPFLRHEFFAALEDSGSTNKESGWQAHHLLIHDSETLVLAMPLFLKYHSYGEYVFDWSWADALHRQGVDYYPKLLNAIPFTPATGPRWGIKRDVNIDQIQCLTVAFETIQTEAKKHHYSSCHILFPQQKQAQQIVKIDTSYHQRSGCQYHWFNEDYQHFDDFLSTFTSRKRKNLKKERRRIEEQEIDLVVKEGGDLTEGDWQDFYLFYHLTYFKRSGRQGYLSESFFPLLGQSLPKHIVMMQAKKDQQTIAAALYFKDSKTLYGRYWGCKAEYDQLHFEACYYQGIEYAIKHGLKKFDPGAQGEHKIQRGFIPSETLSYHWIQHPQFSDAIKRFVNIEAKEISAYIEEAKKGLPFKSKVEFENKKSPV